MNKNFIIQKIFLFCTVMFFSSTSVWSTNELKIEEEKGPKVRHIGNLNILPVVIIKEIMKYDGVAKILGNVCKDLLKLYSDSKSLTGIIENEGDINKIHAFKFLKPNGLKFAYTPNKETLERVSKKLNIVYMDLSSTDIDNASMLGGIHTLILSCCYKIENISMLKGVHTLDLSFCRTVKDISMLGGVHTLDLSFCLAAKDVSGLEGVHNLNLSFTGVEDVSMLGKVHKLSLLGCKAVKDVSNLEKLNTLYLPKVELTGFDKLRTVKNLFINQTRYNFK